MGKLLRAVHDVNLHWQKSQKGAKKILKFVLIYIKTRWAKGMHVNLFYLIKCFL